MSLEDLEKNLYNPSFRKKKIKEPAGSSGLGEEYGGSARTSWETAGTAKKEARAEVSRAEDEESDGGPSHGKKMKSMLLFGGAMLVLAIVVGGVIFVSRLNRPPEPVGIKIFAPHEINRGVPFEFDVQIENGRDTSIGDARLTINVPSGIINAGGFAGAQAVTIDSIGDVAAGGSAKRTYKLVGVGSVNSIQKISVGLSYTALGSARFETEATGEVLISKSAIEVNIKAPDRILPGSPFNVEIDYKNVSGFDFPDVVLTTQYPSAFKFVSASLPPDTLNNSWRLGAVKSGSNGLFTITGIFQGDENARFSIPFIIGATFLGNVYPLVEDSIALAMAPAPVGITITANGSDSYVARIGDAMNYTIRYENRSGIALADVIVQADISGELFDFSSLQSTGSINSITNTVTWNAATNPELKLVSPGSKGEIAFSVALKPKYPIKRLNDKNFLLRAHASITSPSVPFYLKSSKTEAQTSLETKVSGQIAVDAQAFYRDAVSGIVNAGAVPPRVNMPTEYTIHWLIQNYATDAKTVVLRATLQPGVIWTGIVKSNINSVPLYNDRTQEIAWTIDKIPATQGVLGDPVEAVFQVRAVPSTRNIGGPMPLMSETAIRATDDFTGLDLSANDTALDTSLPDDKTIGQGGGIVQQ